MWFGGGFWGGFRSAFRGSFLVEIVDDGVGEFHNFVGFFFHEDGVFAAVEHAFKHILLESQFANHILFDGVLRHEIDYHNVARLTVAIDATDALFEHCGVPRQVHIDNQRCALQVETRAAGIGGEKHFALRVVLKVCHHFAAFHRRHAAVKIFVGDAAQVEFGGYQPRHALPLAEHHHLVGGVFVDVFLDDIGCFVHFRVVARLLVEDIGAVAHHAHHVEVEQKALVVGFR